MPRTSAIIAGDMPPPAVSDYQKQFPGSFYYQPSFAPTASPRALPSFMGHGTLPMASAPTGTPSGYELPAAWAMPQPDNWFSFAPSRGTAGPSIGLGNRGLSGTPVGSSLPPSTLTGSPPVTGKGGDAYGGVPTIPNPLSSTGEAADFINANMKKLFPNLDKTLAEIDSWLGGKGPTPTNVSGNVIGTNAANLPAVNNLLTGIEPNIPATWDVINANLGGHVTQPEINLLTQYGAERGTGTGFGVMSPHTESAVMAALGNLAYDRQQRGVEQAQGFGSHLYNMARPFFVTPGEEAGAQLDLRRSGLSAASSAGHDIYGAIGNLANELQQAKYAANVNAAAPNPEAVAREAERLREKAAWLEYQLALAAANQGGRSVPQGGASRSAPSGQVPVPFYQQPQSTATTKSTGSTTKPIAPGISFPREFLDGRYTAEDYFGPRTVGTPERYGEGTGEAYFPGLNEFGMQYDPVRDVVYRSPFGGFYDYAPDNYETPSEFVGDFPFDFGIGYDSFA